MRRFFEINFVKRSNSLKRSWDRSNLKNSSPYSSLTDIIVFLTPAGMFLFSHQRPRWEQLKNLFAQETLTSLQLSDVLLNALEFESKFWEAGPSLDILGSQASTCDWLS